METPLRYIIIDDDEVDRAVIETQANKFPFLQKIVSCTNPLEAIEIIHQSNPDIIFLDIEMPGISGIDFLRKKMISDSLPVLISSHPEFALDGFELEAFDYILKPGHSSENVHYYNLHHLDFVNLLLQIQKMFPIFPSKHYMQS